MSPTTAGIHCEHCGLGIEAVVVQYCLDCGLYVCPGCGSSSQRRCQACTAIGPSRRNRGGVSLRTARRADRRLRETTREAVAIAVAAASPDGRDAWADYACLTIKATTAERAGMRALRRLTGASATTARPLDDRIRRHALGAGAALERAAGALSGIEARAKPNAAQAGEGGVASADHLSSNLHFALVTAGVFLVIGVLIAPVLLNGAGGTQSPREEILGASESTASPIVTPSANSTPRGGQGVVRTPEANVLAIDFDEVRMGSGIGADWRMIAGGVNAVAVAAFPTAVDRSARLETIAGDRVETCLPLQPASHLTRLSVDVLLTEPTATAAVSVTLASGSPVLDMSLGTSAITVTDGGRRVLAESDGLEAGGWYRAGIVWNGEQTIVRVTPVDGTPEAVYESPVEPHAVDTVGEVCLAASGESEDAVHFDDLTIATIEEG